MNKELDADWISFAAAARNVVAFLENGRMRGSSPALGCKSQAASIVVTTEAPAGSGEEDETSVVTLATAERPAVERFGKGILRTPVIGTTADQTGAL